MIKDGLYTEIHQHNPLYKQTQRQKPHDPSMCTLWFVLQSLEALGKVDNFNLSILKQIWI